MKKNFVLLLIAAMMLPSFAIRSLAQQERKPSNTTPAEKPTESKSSATGVEGQEGEDPDLPDFAGASTNKQHFLLARDEQINLLRGFPYATADSRVRAIYAMKRQEMAMANREQAIAERSWQAIGPAPIPNGQTNVVSTPVSGRTSAIAVHPTNPNIAYVGTAQGGLYRTLDGGTTWTPLLDGALSLAIGSVAICPSDPSIVFVGTGEPVFSADSFFGVGIYRITTADTNPVVAGPLNSDGAGGDVFTGRSVSEILVHPTDPNILFASTTSGIGGLGGSQPVVAPARGLYRTTNALAAIPTFTKLTVATASFGDRSISDMVMEPGNPNRLICGVYGLLGAGDGGLYLTTNALDANPTFTQTLQTGTATANHRIELAINKVAGVVTVLAATGTNNGELRKSIDGGATWSTPLAAANGFCNPQCFYDIAIAIDQENSNLIYLGGSPVAIFRKSINGGTSFTTSATGLHVDSHVITIAPSNPNVIYFGSDGGVWKSTDQGGSWINLNNTTFSATQFQSISLHPVDRYFTIGGTQDNGTEFLRPSNTWVRAVGGDGGQSVIDQNATDNVNVTMYHTFFNQTGSQIGFNRISTVNPTGMLQTGLFLGCGGTANGISCSDATLFYAPLTRGPGNPNTLYFGTDRLYRSDNRGTSMTVVSQAPLPARVSAIGISPQNDNVRIIGLTNGSVFATTTGSATLTDITGPIPPTKYISRAVVDPTNPDVAYVTVSGFGLGTGQHVWKTSNLSNAGPTWTVAGNGIPDVPVSAFVVDPSNPNTLYAGTDIGVYRSTDGAATWTPFSNGLPRVAVFDMAIHNTHRFLRIATHGRGIYEMNLRPGSAVADFDGDGKTDISVFRPSAGTWYVTNSSNSAFVSLAFGTNGDRIAAGDYDGDGKADFAVFRPADSTWYIQQSTAGFRSQAFGLSADTPVASDYDGDGKADIAVFRPSDNTWYLQQSTAGFRAQAWGTSGDRPAPGDYDGDGKTDFAVFRPSNGTWYVLESSTGSSRSQAFGTNGDKPVAGDYDGDGKTDFAVFRPSDGTWYIQQSTAGFRGQAFGFGTDIAAPGDFDGDGKTDLAVFRATEGTWYLQQSTAGFRAFAFGMNGDVPVPSGYVP
jgi:hypothetical protein